MTPYWQALVSAAALRSTLGRILPRASYQQTLPKASHLAKGQPERQTIPEGGSLALTQPTLFQFHSCLEIQFSQAEAAYFRKKPLTLRPRCDGNENLFNLDISVVGVASQYAEERTRCEGYIGANRAGVHGPFPEMVPHPKVALFQMYFINTAHHMLVV